MSLVSDAQALYDGINGSWAKTKVHVYSHLIFIAVVFLVFRADVPSISLQPISSHQVSSNGWFVLARDSGILYIALAIPVLLGAGYMAFVSAMSRFFCGLIASLAPPINRNVDLRFLNAFTLEPLACLIDKNDFTFSDLLLKSQELQSAYQLAKNDAWQSFQKAVLEGWGDSRIMLGDMTFFIVLWNALFVFFPHSEWILRHHDLRVSVSVVFLVIIVFMWIRVTHALSVIPAMRLVCVSMLIRADPRFEAELRGDPESRHVMRERLNELLAHEKKRETSKPSVIRYLAHKAKRLIGDSNKIRSPRRVFRVLRDLYNEGLMVEWSPDLGRPQPMQSERRFVSYLVYRLIQRLMITGKTVALFLERLIFGYP